MIPTLQTKRLVLRPYRRDDFAIYAAFMASDRAIYMGGPYDRDKAWASFTDDIASWALYGFGSLAMEHDGKLVGGAGLIHPPHFPEPECGWFVYDAFEGLGLATEAGRAILNHVFATTDLPSIVSYIGERNAASIRVAEKLGGILDPHAEAPEDEGTLVYRHRRGAA
jgi:RimJ/RimL family protein N-acetyltransferase